MGGIWEAEVLNGRELGKIGETTQQYCLNILYFTFYILRLYHSGEGSKNNSQEKISRFL